MQYSKNIGLALWCILLLIACKPNKKQLLGEWQLASITLEGSDSLGDAAAEKTIAKFEQQLADKYFFFDAHNRYGLVNDFGDTLELTSYTSTAKKLVIDNLENNYQVAGDTLWIQEVGKQAKLKLYRMKR